MGGYDGMRLNHMNHSGYRQMFGSHVVVVGSLWLDHCGWVVYGRYVARIRTLDHFGNEAMVHVV